LLREVLSAQSENFLNNLSIRWANLDSYYKEGDKENTQIFCGNNRKCTKSGELMKILKTREGV